MKIICPLRKWDFWLEQIKKVSKYSQKTSIKQKKKFKNSNFLALEIYQRQTTNGEEFSYKKLLELWRNNIGTHRLIAGDSYSYNPRASLVSQVVLSGSEKQ